MPQSFLIRPARAQDQSTIKHLVNDERLNPLGLRWPNFLVAEDPGRVQVIGCIQVRPHRSMPELASLVVAQPYRRAGVGHALVETLLAQYPGDLFLMCELHMTGYYQRFGFAKASPAHLPLGYKLFYRLSELVRPGELCTMLKAKH